MSHYVVKEIILTFVKNGNEDFIQNYCNRGERLNSTPNIGTEWGYSKKAWHTGAGQGKGSGWGLVEKSPTKVWLRRQSLSMSS